MLDLVVEGNAYLDGEINKCCIGIESGKIVDIKKILKGAQQFDFGEKLILPAGNDIHVHFRDPGFRDKEDFSTGTMAAAFGGIGCIFDMPNTKPLVISKEKVLEKFEIVSKKAYIDFGLYSSITPKANIPKIAKVCSAFKIYLGTTTGDLLFSNDDLLASALYQINETGRIPAIHAETERIIQQHIKPDRPAKNLHEYLRQRPNEAEVNAVSTLFAIANRWKAETKKIQTGPKKKANIESDKGLSSTTFLHICHVSTAEVVGLLREHISHPHLPNHVKQIDNASKNDSVIVSTEVTPHHLLLNANCGLGAFGKVNPPLRRPEDQASVWSAFVDGTIQILASDHAPHTVGEKTQEFNLAPAGIPGVETMLPLMLSHHKHHKLTLDRLVSAVATKPASMFNLPKGRLAIGYDGDLIVVDFYNEDTIKAKNLHSRCAWTPYENMLAIFPRLTVVRGNIIVKDGNVETDPGFGKFYN